MPFFLLLKNKYINLLLLLLFIIIIGLRVNVGFDYDSYINIISNINDIKQYNSEILSYNLLLFANIYKNYQIYFLITSVIIYSLIFITLYRDSSNLFISVLIFLSLPIFFISSLSIIRQYCAMAVILYGQKYIFERNIIKYLYIVFLATLFHNSAIFSLFLYYIFNLRNINIILFILLVLNVVLSTILDKLMQAINISYIQYYYRFYILNQVHGGGELVIYLLLFLIIILYVFRKKIIKNNKQKYYLDSSTIGVLLYIFLIKYGHVTRITYYYIINIIIISPKIITLIKEKTIIFILIIILYFIFYYYNIYLSFNNPVKNYLYPFLIGFNNVF
jgi:hypothetical protein